MVLMNFFALHLTQLLLNRTELQQSADYMNRVESSYRFQIGFQTRFLTRKAKTQGLDNNIFLPNLYSKSLWSQSISNRDLNLISTQKSNKVMVCSAVHLVKWDILLRSSPNLAHLWSKDVGRCDINWSSSSLCYIQILTRSRFMTFCD